MHKRLKSPIAPLFAPANVPSFEGRVDEVLECLRDKLDQNFTENSAVVDLGQWLQFFAFDVLGTLTFSKRYGFLDAGKNIGRMLGTIADFIRSAAPVSCLSPCRETLSRCT